MAADNERRVDNPNATYIIYPESRWVADSLFPGWYNDAVAKGQVTPGATTIADMVSALDDAGIITRGPAPIEVGDLWLAWMERQWSKLPLTDPQWHFFNGMLEAIERQGGLSEEQFAQVRQCYKHAAQATRPRYPKGVDPLRDAEDEGRLARRQGIDRIRGNPYDDANRWVYVEGEGWRDRWVFWREGWIDQDMIERIKQAKGKQGVEAEWLKFIGRIRSGQPAPPGEHEAMLKALADPAPCENSSTAPKSSLTFLSPEEVQRGVAALPPPPPSEAEAMPGRKKKPVEWLAFRELPPIKMLGTRSWVGYSDAICYSDNGRKYVIVESDHKYEVTCVGFPWGNAIAYRTPHRVNPKPLKSFDEAVECCKWYEVAISP